MKKISLLLACLLSLGLALSGCGSKAMVNDMAAAAPQGPAYAPDYEWSEKNDYGFSDSIGSGFDSPLYDNPNAKIIRSAELDIQTTEFEASVAALGELTQSMDGYYETAQVDAGGIYNQYARRSGYYVVRVPKENFVKFRDAMGTVGHVFSITENVQDVGESYYDTEARLNTLTTKRDRLMELLAQADKMEDIITLENALADVQYQIDMHTSTLRKYDSLIGYSTFTVRINEVAKITEESAVTESFGSRLGSNLKNGFREFGEGLGDFVLWIARNLMGIIVFAAVVICAAIVIPKAVRRSRAKKNKAE